MDIKNKENGGSKKQPHLFHSSSSRRYPRHIEEATVGCAGQVIQHRCVSHGCKGLLKQRENQGCLGRPYEDKNLRRRTQGIVTLKRWAKPHTHTREEEVVPTRGSDSKWAVAKCQPYGEASMSAVKPVFCVELSTYKKVLASIQGSVESNWEIWVGVLPPRCSALKEKRDRGGG